MKRIFELPPAPSGSTQQQVDALRDYLLRLVLELNSE